MRRLTTDLTRLSCKDDAAFGQAEAGRLAAYGGCEWAGGHSRASGAGIDMANATGVTGFEHVWWMIGVRQMFGTVRMQ